MPLPRTLALLTVLGLTDASSLAAQGAWGKVRAWAGTVTIEITQQEKTETSSWVFTYRATGDFRISDDALPDGDHMQWPMPNPEAMTDPAKVQAAYKPWQARAVATYEFKGVDEAGQAVTARCTADELQASSLGVISDPAAPKFILQVTAPHPKYSCTGEWAQMVTVPRPQQAAYSLGGPRGEPGPVTGTQTFTEGARRSTVTYKFAPAK